LISVVGDLNLPGSMILRSLSAMIYCVALCQSDSNDECGLISESDVSSASESFVFSSSFTLTEGCTRDEICNKETKPHTCVCKEGFTRDGENCNPTTTCKRPAPPRRFGSWSTVDARENELFYPGDRILYKCDSGYALKSSNGKKFRKCGADGLWYPKRVPVCV
ncbi:uncharacterized protein LOC117102162, partial [Anneissia japonica]|uniref:uncharacterized protein LOC117102162 n=1 Tax=Anneissia japonica TaxID=1529436 RepID=UPI0014255554